MTLDEAVEVGELTRGLQNLAASFRQLEAREAKEPLSHVRLLVDSPAVNGQANEVAIPLALARDLLGHIRERIILRLEFLGVEVPADA